MASTLAFTSSLPLTIRASAGFSRRPDADRKKASSPTWWAPLFGWSSDPDYINTTGGNTGGSVKQIGVSEMETESDPGRSRSRYTLGCFTEEKARQLRRKTMEGSSFHDMMYHSAIASRLASDLSGQPDN